jgi:hypothetical protein
MVEARSAQAHVRYVSAQVHLELADKKRQEPSQRIQYTGIIVDTVAGRLFCPPEKLAGVVTALRNLMARTSAGARVIAGCRGKLQH